MDVWEIAETISSDVFLGKNEMMTFFNVIDETIIEHAVRCVKSTFLIDDQT